MSIVHGLEGLAVFLAAAALVGGIIFGWVAGWMSIGDWLDSIGAPEWCGQMAACFMPFSPVIFGLLALVFGVAAHS